MIMRQPGWHSAGIISGAEESGIAPEQIWPSRYH